MTNQQMSEEISRGIADWQQAMNEGNEAYEGRKYMEAELKFAAALRMVEKESHGEAFDNADESHRFDIRARMARSLNNMAALYHTQGMYAMAEEHYERGLELKKSLFGAEHMEVAVVLHNLAVMYSAKRRFEKAEELYTRSLAIKESVLGENSVELVPQLKNIALLLRRVKREDEADQIEARIKKIQEEHS